MYLIPIVAMDMVGNFSRYLYSHNIHYHLSVSKQGASRSYTLYSFYVRCSAREILKAHEEVKFRLSKEILDKIKIDAEREENLEDYIRDTQAGCIDLSEE